MLLSKMSPEKKVSFKENNRRNLTTCSKIELINQVSTELLIKYSSEGGHFVTVY